MGAHILLCGAERRSQTNRFAIEPLGFLLCSDPASFGLHPPVPLVGAARGDGYLRPQGAYTYWMILLT